MANTRVPPSDTIIFERAEVIVVGAGPVGLLVALKLAKAGIEVTVIEQEKAISRSPRATTYAPIVLHELEKLGVYKDLELAGYKNTEGVTFRKPHSKGGDFLARLSMNLVPKGEVKYAFAGIHLGQGELADIILSHCQQQKTFRLIFGQRFAGVQQSGEGDKPVHATFVGPAGETSYKCDYLVGCDGAGSSVRRSQCIPFEGFTWKDFRFVASDVIYDFEGYGDFTTANMIVDDEDWAVIARTGPGNAPWRVAFGVRTNIPESEILAQLPKKFESLFPGPRPLKYELVNANPYWAHQRVARTMRVGRIILCGDAAHSNNPIGGLGLTTGLLDAVALGNCLIRIFQQGEADSILDRYATVRREAWIKYSNPQSIEFKRRIHVFDPETVQERDAFFHVLNTDPEVHLKTARMMNAVMVDDFEIPPQQQKL